MSDFICTTQAHYLNPWSISMNFTLLILSGVAIFAFCVVELHQNKLVLDATYDYVVKNILNCLRGKDAENLIMASLKSLNSSSYETNSKEFYSSKWPCESLETKKQIKIIIYFNKLATETKTRIIFDAKIKLASEKQRLCYGQTNSGRKKITKCTKSFQI